ncbi:MAG: hypothetical protein SCH71_06775 [Desulfobulbaceae bacterium]|nr:hypothetical protein [Desulfobulbaceae bacterium]
MNKNVVIFILVLFTLLGSIWGSVADRKKVSLEVQLEEMTAEMEKLDSRASKEREQVLGKTAGLQETLAEKDKQLQKARTELVALRKSTKAVESQLSECTASLQEMNQKNENSMQEIQAAKKTIASLQAAAEKQEGKQQTVQQPKNLTEEPRKKNAETAEKKQEEPALQDQLQAASLTVEYLRQEFNACNAQIIGLEKLVDEKNSAIDATTQEMDRLRINMDVLLSKIADQRESLQKLQEKNRQMVKELGVKNKEIASLQEEVMGARPGRIQEKY